MADENARVERLKVWQCIGCGKIEAPKPCIGVCEEHKVEIVYAFEHDQAIAQASRHAETLTAFVRRLACTTPREGEWERSYRAFQNQARQTLAALDLDSAQDT